MATLFEPFRRRQKPGEYAFSGSGLGLSICRKLVEAMGSSLWTWRPARARAPASTSCSSFRWPANPQFGLTATPAKPAAPLAFPR